MNIIFHYPLPIDPLAKSASGIRPMRMLDAFLALGCQVDIISGYAAERKRAIKIIKAKILQGTEYAFMYAESSTQPTTLTDRHHLPLHPWLDGGFFHFCKRHRIPVGLFYRDIYWRFNEYGSHLHPIKIIGAKLAYFFDLLIYKHTLSKLYLPSLKMGEYVPVVNPELFEELPPGHSQYFTQAEELEKSNNNTPLSIFYVGGISNHYKMHALFEAVESLPDVELIFCTRKSEWDSIKHEYSKIGNNIKIIHDSGQEMENQLKKSDVASIFVAPQEYWKFAAPVKLYEYIGFLKPVIASSGTLTGSFVEAKNIGWTIEYNTAAIKTFLQALAQNKDQLKGMRRSMRAVSTQHSWQARAQQVIKGLRRQ